MPRKKLSPFNRSRDEGYSEEIQSDSSLESNSRRNTRRKKPHRKDSSKENRINLLLQSTKEKPQGNSSEKNEKRPSIIKIFRRIDRKAKNIYLVDDKMEDSNVLITPSEPKCFLNIPDKGKSSCSIESPYHKKSLFSSCTKQRSATTFEERPIRTIKTDRREQNDLGKVVVRNLSSKLDSLYSSATDIDEIYNKTDSSNMPIDIDASISLVTNIGQEPNKAAVWNMHRGDTVTDFDQTPSGSDVSSQLLSSYSDPSNSSEVSDDQTSAAADVCFQQSSSDFDASISGSDEILIESDSSENIGQELNKTDSNTLYTSVIDFDQAPSGSDVYIQILTSDSSNSSEVSDDQTSNAADVCLQQSSSDFDASISGSDEILNESDSSENIGQEPIKSDVWNTHRDINALYNSVTDFDETPSGSSVYSQLLSSYSDASNSSEVSNDLASTAADVCFQQSRNDFYASVIGGDEISNESLHSSLLLNSYIDASNISSTDSDYELTKAEDDAYRQPPTNDLDVSSFLLTCSDLVVDKANEFF